MFEKLIALFERGVVALEKIASSGGVISAPSADAPAPPVRKRKASDTEAPPAAPPPAPTPPAAPPADPFGDDEGEPEKEVTQDDVRAAMQKYRAKHGDGPALAMFKKIGEADTLKTLSKDKYAAVYKAANAG